MFVLNLCFITSCVEYQDAVSSTIIPDEIIIEATQEGRKVETRTTLQNDGSVYWNPNDEISVFFNQGERGGSKFISQNTETTEIAEFAGSIYGFTGGGENLQEDARFWAVYPYSENNSCDGNSIITTLPNIQQAVEGSFADDLFITIAQSENVKMAFKNVCGGVKFCVSNDNIKSIIFRGNNNENLAGKVSVSLDENKKPVITKIIDGEDEVMVTAPNGGFFKPGKYYYIVTFPTPLENGFTITFNTSNNSHIECNRTGSVTINRSKFGVISNLDTGEAVPDEIIPGGSESGFYLGIIGFNNGLYSYPISHLSANTIAGYNGFIDKLSIQNGTLLYYAVDESINHLQEATFPSDLYDVSIVTFTDGLDRGSLDMSDNYLTNSDYLTALNARLTGEKVSNQSIAAYSVGVRGDDVTNTTSFQNNLKKLATSSQNVFEVTNMSEVNDAFSQIADLLGETKYKQTFMLAIKGPSHSERCRFTFDNISSYNASRQYIEGTFNRLDKTLTNVTYVGLTSTSGQIVNGVKNDANFYVFTFEDLQSLDGELVPTDCVQHWYTEEGVWQKDSEFSFDPGDVSIERIKRSAAILLNLDCSSSLGSDFVTLQKSAKAFISKLLEYSTDPYEVASIELTQSEINLTAGNTTQLSAIVTPSTAIQKEIEWYSTNTSVAFVDQKGLVTSFEPGEASIIAKTKDGNLTATCLVTVAPAPIYYKTSHELCETEIKLFGTYSLNMNIVRLFDAERLYYNPELSGWNSNNVQYWISGALYNFYAIAPYNVSCTFSDKMGFVTLDNYESKTGAPDLLYAATKRDLTENNNFSAVPLMFCHACATLKFKIVNESSAKFVDVRNIRLVGLHNRGDFSFDAEGKAVWQLDASTISPTALTQPFDGVCTLPNTGLPVNSDVQHSLYDEGKIFVLPQTIYKTPVTLHMEYIKAGDVEYAVRNVELGWLGGAAPTEWKAGWTYEYILIITDNAITISVSEVESRSE